MASFTVRQASLFLSNLSRSEKAVYQAQILERKMNHIAKLLKKRS